MTQKNAIVNILNEYVLRCVEPIALHIWLADVSYIVLNLIVFYSYIIGDIHRNAISSFKPTLGDANDINAWGLGMPPGKKYLNVTLELFKLSSM